MEILLLENVSSLCEKLLSPLGYKIRREQKLPENLENVCCLCIRSRTKVGELVLQRMPNLKCLACFCVGLDQVDLQACEKRGIVVFNAPFSSGRSVAELIIAQVINLSRRVGENNTNMHEGKWRKTSRFCHEVRGKSLGIIGYGNIGSQVGILAEALGMKVTFCDVLAKLAYSNAKQINMNELLLTSDFVTVHVPEQENKAYVLGEKELKLMKRGSYLLNASRGSVVDMQAVVSALREKRLWGAYFDVYDEEPEENESTFTSPLQNMENVILSPHIGGSTEEAQERIAHYVCQQISQLLASC